MSRPIDSFILSCGRTKLLYETLKSFYQFNTYPIGKMIIGDDYGSYYLTDEMKADWLFFQEKYPHIKFMATHESRGQIIAYDALVKQMTTPYFFTCEEDWQFYRSGFIEQSIDVLEDNENITQVLIRSDKDLNHMKPEDAVFKTKSGVQYSIINTRGVWGHFSFNPSVRRLSDAISFKDITTFNIKIPNRSERDISAYYKRLGKKIAVIRGEGFVRHTGATHHINEKHWQN